MKSSKKTLADKIIYKNEFIKKNYDRVSVVIPKGKKEQYKVYAKMVKGCSLNKLINDLLEAELDN